MKKLKPILTIGACCLGLLLAVWLIGNAIWIRTTGSQLEDRLTALRNAGDPVTLADLAQPKPPDEQNAAVVLRQVQADVAALMRELYLIDHRFTRRGSHTLDAEQNALRTSLDTYPRVLPLLEQAAACPDYDPELPYTGSPEKLVESMLAEVQHFRNYANILRAQATVLRSQSDRDGALRACLVSFRLARHLEREPLLISYLVVVACRSVAINQVNAVLRAGPVSDTARAEMDKELAISSDVRGFLQALKGERAYAISAFRTSVAVNWVNRALFSSDASYVLDQMEEQMALVSQPYAAVVASEARLKQQLSGPFHPLSTLQLPALFKTREAMDRVRAQIRCLRILNALQRQGPGPDKERRLTELGLPADAITDPYTGSPIKLVRANGEWLIYCVGPNLIDDGGQLESLADVGIGPL